MYANTFYESTKADVHSQNGEDGVIGAMLERMNVGPLKHQWVCEFGAWDGKYLSNTFNLVQKGARAVFIEGDAVKFKDLRVTCDSYPNIVPILAMVLPGSLDSLLERTAIPHDFLLLSVDIDSCDYQVWEKLATYRPRIVVIEIDSSVPPTEEKSVHGVNGRIGTGFLPMLQLARSKDYEFLTHTGNMIFVRREDAHFFDIPSDPTTCFRTDWLSTR